MPLRFAGHRAYLNHEPRHSMQAISTRYFGPTNTLGARIKATCERGSITIPLDYGLSGDAIHRAAVMALVLRFMEEDFKRGTPKESNPWNRPFASGSLPDGTMAHVLL